MGCISPPGFPGSPGWVQANGGTSRSSAGEKKEKSPPPFPPPHCLPACRGPTFLHASSLGYDVSCWMPPPPCSHLGSLQEFRVVSCPGSIGCQVLEACYRCLLVLLVWAPGRAVLVPIALPISLKKSPFTQFSPKFSGTPIFSGYKVKVHPLSASICSGPDPSQHPAHSPGHQAARSLVPALTL